VLAFGRTDVVAMAMSLSARATDGRDEDYLRWHLLDHLPEQYRIPGVRHGARWVSTPRCRAARIAQDDRYDAVDHVTTYLFAEPLTESLDAFCELGRTLREAGRLPVSLPAIELGGYRLAARGADEAVRLGADVLPWRPHRGILLLIERSDAEPVVADLLSIAGVSGAWAYRGEADLFRGRFADTGGVVATMCYLDADPVEVAAAARVVLSQRWSSDDVSPCDPSRSTPRCRRPMRVRWAQHDRSTRRTHARPHPDRWQGLGGRRHDRGRRPGRTGR
jgi:hypothetical protein